MLGQRLCWWNVSFLLGRRWRSGFTSWSQQDSIPSAISWTDRHYSDINVGLLMPVWFISLCGGEWLDMQKLSCNYYETWREIYYCNGAIWDCLEAHIVPFAHYISIISSPWSQRVVFATLLSGRYKPLIPGWRYVTVLCIFFVLLWIVYFWQV